MWRSYNISMKRLNIYYNKTQEREMKNNNSKVKDII